MYGCKVLPTAYCVYVRALERLVTAQVGSTDSAPINAQRRVCWSKSEGLWKETDEGRDIFSKKTGFFECTLTSVWDTQTLRLVI